MIDVVSVSSTLRTSERTRTDALLAGQTRALELLVTGRPLQDVLNALVATVEDNTGALSLSLKSLRPHLGEAGFSALQQLQTQVAAVEREVHALALELRPTALDDLGLASALIHFIEGWSSRTGVTVEYHRAALEAVRYSPPIETAVYRIVQEALTNVGKHAQAGRVGVIVEQHAGELLTIVADDGVGFEPGTTPEGRLGVLGMRERAAKCGGTLKIESEAGAGTTVCVRIPVAGVQLTHA